MAFSITLGDEQWALVADLFDPPGRRGTPARIDRRSMVDAMLFLARTGCQWRYLLERFPPWGAVWQQLRLSRCFEGTAVSARAWLDVVSMAYLFSRL